MCERTFLVDYFYECSVCTVHFVQIVTTEDKMIVVMIIDQLKNPVS